MWLKHWCNNCDLVQSTLISVEYPPLTNVKMFLVNWFISVPSFQYNPPPHPPKKTFWDRVGRQGKILLSAITLERNFNKGYKIPYGSLSFYSNVNLAPNPTFLLLWVQCPLFWSWASPGYDVLPAPPLSETLLVALFVYIYSWQEHRGTMWLPHLIHSEQCIYFPQYIYPRSTQKNDDES